MTFFEQSDLEVTSGNYLVTTLSVSLSLSLSLSISSASRTVFFNSHKPHEHANFDKNTHLTKFLSRSDFALKSIYELEKLSLDAKNAQELYQTICQRANCWFDARVGSNQLY